VRQRRFIPLTPGLLDQAVNLLVHNEGRDLRAGSDGPGSSFFFDARHYGQLPTGRAVGCADEEVVVACGGDTSSPVSARSVKATKATAMGSRRVCDDIDAIMADCDLFLRDGRWFMGEMEANWVRDNGFGGALHD
jgi:hypothetical protein